MRTGGAGRGGVLAVVTCLVLLTECRTGTDGEATSDPVPSSTTTTAAVAPTPPPTTTSRTPFDAFTWKARTAAPEARQEVAAAAVAGRIWVVGGITAAGASSTVESYDPAADRWTRGPDLPVALHHSTAVAFRGELVVVGGFEAGDGDLYRRASDRVLVFRNGLWTELGRLHRPRGAAAAAVVGDTLYLAGGRDGTSLVGPTEAFDGTGWQDRAPIPEPRDHLGAVSDGRYLYAVGGRHLGADQTTGTVERYDPAVDGWSALAPVPTARGGHGVSLAGGRVIVAGGEDAEQTYSQVEAFDPATGSWSSLAPMTTPRHGLALVAVGDGVYALVGGTRSGVAPSAVAEVLTAT